MGGDTTSGNNATLEREHLGCKSVVTYSSLFLLVDVWKHVTVYGMKYFNDGQYPVPQTQIVAIVELLKCIIFLCLLIHNGGIKTMTISYWYAIPSMIYAVNNNVYLYGLSLTTPPIWNILSQQRIVFTAIVYRFVFKKYLSKTQLLGLGLLITAIIGTSVTDGSSVNAQGNVFAAFVLNAVGCLASVGGTVTIEYLFKNDKRDFTEKQMLLYSFSFIAAVLLCGVEATVNGLEPLYSVSGDYNTVIGLLILGVLFAVLSGMAVAVIVKRLDNIVKLYTQALSNMLTSVACAFIFPSKFILDIQFISCLLLMTVAIMLYETKNWLFDSFKNDSSCIDENKQTGEV